MPNHTAADRKVFSLLRLVGKPTHSDALIRGTARILLDQPSKAALMRLAGEVDAWEHLLRSEGNQANAGDTIVTVHVLNKILGAAVEATPEPPDETVLEQVLEVLTKLGAARPGQIADELGKTRPQISQVLRTLRDNGLVEVDETTDRDDRRATIYRPTRRALEHA